MLCIDGNTLCIDGYVRGFHQVGTSPVSKIQNKRNKNEKTYLEVSNRSKNLLSVQNRSEILCDNNRLSNQLLLSSEIGPFEGGTVVSPKNPQNTLNSIEIYYGSTKDFAYRVPVGVYKENLGKLMIFDLEYPNFCLENPNFLKIIEMLRLCTVKRIYLRAQEELVGQTVVVTY